MEPNNKLQSESRPERPKSGWLDYSFLKKENFWIAVVVILIVVGFVFGNNFV